MDGFFGFFLPTVCMHICFLSHTRNVALVMALFYGFVQVKISTTSISWQQDGLPRDYIDMHGLQRMKKFRFQ